MTVDPSVIPGLLFLLAELVALAAIGYVIVRVALRETDDRVALAQGLVVGLAIWGVVVNLVMYALPGLPGAVAGWIFVLALAAVLTWRAREPIRPRLRIAAGFALAALAVFWIALASRQTWIPSYTGSPGAVRLDPRRRISTRAVLESGRARPLPLRRRYVSRAAGAADRARPGLHDGVDGRLCLDEPRPGGGHSPPAARLPHCAVLAIAPLMLTAAAWGLWNGEPASVVEAPVATVDPPAAGLRASLADVYWRAGESHYLSVLANVSKPAFTHVVRADVRGARARAACAGRRSWLSVITLATH